MSRPPELAIVVATLLTASTWVGEPERDLLLDAAEETAGCDLAALRLCCPVCQELVCDPGCPLETVRQRLEEA